MGSIGVAAVLGAVLTLTFGPAVWPDVQGAGGQAQQLMERAEQHYRAGESRESLRLLSQAIDAIDAVPDAPDAQALLERALYYRARVNVDLDDGGAASRDIERLLARVPETRIDASLVSRPFAELFHSVRARTVTDLEISVRPRDAEVRVDSRLVGLTATGIAVRPGTHVITATSPGYAAVSREIEVPLGGRVRLDLELEPLAVRSERDASGSAAELQQPQRWVVFHVHRGTYCGGRLSLEGHQLSFRSVSEEAHSFAVPLVEVRDVEGNKMLVGGLKYGGSFHIKLASGANFNFVSDGFPADQLVLLLKAAVQRAAKDKRETARERPSALGRRG